MTPDTIERARAVVARVLGLPVGEVDDRTSFWTVEAWDSLRHVKLLAELESAFGRRVPDHEAGRVVDFPAICAVFLGGAGRPDRASGPPAASPIDPVEAQLESPRL